MSEPFLSEIRMFGFNFAPRGWAKCDGQLVPINQNQSLYSLLGTNFGGDGRVSFALPDMRSRIPVYQGNQHSIGAKFGKEQITSQAVSQITDLNVDRGLATTTSTAKAANTSQAVDAPYLTVNFAIAIAGLFPSRN